MTEARVGTTACTIAPVNTPRLLPLPPPTSKRVSSSPSRFSLDRADPHPSHSLTVRLNPRSTSRSPLSVESTSLHRTGRKPRSIFLSSTTVPTISRPARHSVLFQRSVTSDRKGHDSAHSRSPHDPLLFHLWGPSVHPPYPLEPVEPSRDDRLDFSSRPAIGIDIKFNSSTAVWITCVLVEDVAQRTVGSGWMLLPFLRRQWPWLGCLRSSRSEPCKTRHRQTGHTKLPTCIHTRDTGRSTAAPEHSTGSRARRSRRDAGTTERPEQRGHD